MTFKNSSKHWVYLCTCVAASLITVMPLQAQVLVNKPGDSTALIEYQKRITRSRIEGRYIPKDLNEALAELDKLVEPTAKAQFKGMSEDSARMKTHFSFGRWMEVRWSLQEGSRLSEWFRLNKVSDIDNMMDCLITTYHRKLNGKPLEFESLVNYYYKKQKEKVKDLKAKEAKTAKKTVIRKSVKPKPKTK